MVYNRYDGNTGRVRRVEEPFAPDEAAPPPPPEPAPVLPPPPPPEQPRPGPLPPLPVLSELHLETEDLLLAAVLYLLYRETEDTEFLLILAGVFLM